MTLDGIKERLAEKSILHAEDEFDGRPTVVGYDKRFRWRWFATQLNTFIVASDCGDEEVTVEAMERFLGKAFDYAKKEYRGWPRGLQSGLAVIGVLISTNVSDDAKRYCTKLEAGKKWAGFAVPVVVDAAANEVYAFEKNPIWGRVYYPFLGQLIRELIAA